MASAHVHRATWLNSAGRKQNVSYAPAAPIEALPIGPRRRVDLEAGIEPPSGQRRTNAKPEQCRVTLVLPCRQPETRIIDLDGQRQGRTTAEVVDVVTGDVVPVQVMSAPGLQRNACGDGTKRNEGHEQCATDHGPWARAPARDASVHAFHQTGPSGATWTGYRRLANRRKEERLYRFKEGAGLGFPDAFVPSRLVAIARGGPGARPGIRGRGRRSPRPSCRRSLGSSDPTPRHRIGCRR